MFRAGIYARVSSSDQRTLPLQKRALRDYAVRRGWIIALQVKEVGSGASQRQLREKLLEAARRRQIDVVLVWRLDRWGRSVMRERVRAGLAHARQNGQTLGRPVTAGLPADKARKLHRAGVSKAEIARRLQIGRTSVRRILA
jgi:DNA invertase Pin-like site-specific DNA recombinase